MRRSTAVAVSVFWGVEADGTPVPVASPPRLVLSGFYRYVRNPIYVGSWRSWWARCCRRLSNSSSGTSTGVRLIPTA